MALALALIVAGQGCGRAAAPVAVPPVVPPRSVVSGEVRATGGLAIAGATVTLSDLHVAPSARGAAPAALQHDVLMLTTDAAGRFAFEPIPAGDYVVRGMASGYYPVALPVTVEGGGAPNSVDTTRVTVSLAPLQGS